MEGETKAISNALVSASVIIVSRNLKTSWILFWWKVETIESNSIAATVKIVTDFAFKVATFVKTTKENIV